MDKHEKAERDYMLGMKYREIAEKYNTTINTVKSWKKRYEWDRSGGAPKNKKVCTQNLESEDLGTKETLKNDALTPEQQIFCLYYAKTFNAAQSYQKAYGCSYKSAITSASRLLTKDNVKAEIERLKEFKRQQIMMSEHDIVELQMRIACADIGDYLSFGREKVPVMGDKGPVKVKNKETGQTDVLMIDANTVKLNESSNVDTQLIREVKQGRDGISVKLEDRQKAIDWLSKYFLMHPDDKYKAEYDRMRAKVDDNTGDTVLKDMQTISDIIMHPAENRDIEDFE
ncbi:terminase small subunit [Lachnospiraceae bacterium 38-14]|jgi:Phage terminase, small subunit